MWNLKRLVGYWVLVGNAGSTDLCDEVLCWSRLSWELSDNPNTRYFKNAYQITECRQIFCEGPRRAHQLTLRPHLYCWNIQFSSRRSVFTAYLALQRSFRYCAIPISALFHFRKKPTSIDDPLKSTQDYYLPLDFIIVKVLESLK